MNGQLSLLAEPRVRHDSPRTSREAARTIAPYASELERAIADTVRAAHTPLPADEIAERVFTDNHARWLHGSIVTAISRTRDRGLIVDAGEGLSARNRPARLYAAPETTR